jgi:hypothetical protein
MQAIASQILIHATQVTRDQRGEAYEFILNSQLAVVECGKLDIGQKVALDNIRNFKAVLTDILFELRHVRVNPKEDSRIMIDKLTQAFEEIGVRINNRPEQRAIGICFKPMGEIKDNVRFYLNQEGKLVFLSPTTRPRLVYAKPKP